MRIVHNIVSLKLGWFACILGAAYGLPYFGPVLVLGLLAFHVAFSSDRRGELRIILAAGILGTILDSILLSSGAIAFDSQWAGGWIIPLWMTVLWMNFATALNASLRWLSGRYLLAVPLGAIAGPMSYYAGAELGAASLTASWSLAAIALEWAVAMPLLLLTNHLLSEWARRSPVLQEVAG